jgi:putative endonuclease
MGFLMLPLYQVYLLENSTGRRYIGFSEDIGARLQQHNSGVSRWTRGKGPWRLIWTSEAMSISDARMLENKLKRQKGGSDLFTITGRKAFESTRSVPQSSKPI